jgi:acyl-CoA synthetase (AMP-forming)/AMP-acid ligase II
MTNVFAIIEENTLTKSKDGWKHLTAVQEDFSSSYSYAALLLRANLFASKLSSLLHDETKSHSFSSSSSASSLLFGERIATLWNSSRRTVDLVALQMGIWKLGMSWVPIDVESNPSSRIEFILRDSKCCLVISQDEWSSSSSFDIPTISLQDLLSTSSSSPSSLSSPSSYPINLPAYVMYTSGTTGTPKGVWISHRAIISLSKGGFLSSSSTKDRYLWHSAIGFDATTFELWSALLNGSTVILPQPSSSSSSSGGNQGSNVLSISDFTSLILSQSISVAFITTSLFNLLVSSIEDQNTPHFLSPIRVCLFGGEVASPSHVYKASRYDSRNRSLSLSPSPSPSLSLSLSLFSIFSPLSSDPQPSWSQFRATSRLWAHRELYLRC